MTERVPETWIVRREPWEFISGEWEEKPADLVRDARVQAIALLNAFGSNLEAAIARPGCTVREIKIRFFGIAGALGLNLMDGRSFSSLAADIGCEKASLSKIACEFCRANNLEPSLMMKCTESSASFQRARFASIQRVNGKNGATHA